MDGWMDGEDLIICVAIWTLLQTLRPVNFRRVARGFHSVAKQASFYVALGIDFGGFWSNFGRFWEAKMDAKIDF